MNLVCVSKNDHHTITPPVEFGFRFSLALDFAVAFHFVVWLSVFVLLFFVFWLWLLRVNTGCALCAVRARRVERLTYSSL
jgi:hypothetical protein